MIYDIGHWTSDPFTGEIDKLMTTTFQVDYAGGAVGCAQLHEHGNGEKGQAWPLIQTRL